MSQWTKSFRRYERHILLGIVILLLASFSVTGALESCSSKSGPSTARRLGGSYQASPTRRLEVADGDFDKLMLRFNRYVGSTFQSPTLDFQRWDPSEPKAGTVSAIRLAWMHHICASMAREAGYRCGEGQLSTAIKESLRGAQGMGIQGTREGYEQFLSKLYNGSASEFEGTLREIVMKDELLSVLVDPVRFYRTYAEAYELWKPSRERVDLLYAAAESGSFADEVAQEERTRTALSEQEDLLRALGETARRMKLVQLRLEDAKKDTQAYPAALSDLSAKENQSKPWSATAQQLEDAWGTPLVYVRSDASASLTSAGRDKLAGTADDVGPEVHVQLDAHRTLARTAEALVRWHNGAEPVAWPATLSELLQAPPRKPGESGAPALPVLAPLLKLEQDPWGSDLLYAYAPGAEGAVPTLASAGPDKQPGTADDLTAQVSAERSRVGPGPGLAPYVLTALRDAWEHPLSIYLRLADQGVWEVASAGRDGQSGTADDLVGGNQVEMEMFYGDAAVRDEMREPVKRRFKALIMHLPLVSDATLRQLWLDFPQFRPVSKADDEQLYQRWLTQRGSSESSEFRTGTDPRDPEAGHGAALAKRLGWPAEALTLVPAASVFDVPPEPAPAAPAAPAAPVPAAPAAEPPAAPAPPDPYRKEYDERGWKQILLRQEFLERVLNHFWQDVVASQSKLSAWEASPLKITRRPDAVTMESLLTEDKLGKYMPGAADFARGQRFLESFDMGKDELLTVKQMADLKPFGDPDLPTNRFIAVTTGSEPASIPVQLNSRLTKVLYQNLEYRPDRSPPLTDVRERVFALYLRKKQADRAERELRALRSDVEKRSAERKEGETDEQLWTAAVDAWKQAHPGVTLHLESTGLYIGSERPRRPTLPAAGPEREALLRRLYVRDAGYALVQPVESRQDTVEAKPGTFGRTVLKDLAKGAEATGCAYLVRVKDRVYPSKAEFSPRAYAEWLEEGVFGRMGADPAREANFRMGMRKGAYNQTLAQYVDELERLQVLVDLRTNTNMDQLPAN